MAGVPTIWTAANEPPAKTSASLTTYLDMSFDLQNIGSTQKLERVIK